MNNNEDKIELIDKFLINEKKSKRWTMISVGIFCLLGLLVFYFAYSLNKTNAEKNKALKEFAGIIDRKNDSLNQLNIILNKDPGNYDSLAKAYDTLAILFNRAKSEILNQDTNSAYGWLTDLSRNAFKKQNLVVSDNIKKSVTGMVDENIFERPVVYTVFFQSMPGRFFDLAKRINVTLMNRKNIRVPGIETVERITFNPQIKYYHSEDKAMAEELAGLVNRSDPYFNTREISIQQLNIKAPLHQLEIWIGRYEPKDLNNLKMESYRQSDN